MAKNWGRKMKVNTVNEEQAEAREDMMQNFGSLYECIGNQDALERQMSDCEDNEEEEKDNEEEKSKVAAGNMLQPKQEEKKKKGGFMSNLFGNSKSKATKPQNMASSMPAAPMGSI
jgi:hypothetical protein